MRDKKWPITIAIVVLMIVGGFAAARIARRGANDQARVAADAVQRWVVGHGGGQVQSCSSLTGSDPSAPLYECRIARGCLQTQTFVVPVANGQLAANGVATPSGPPSPRSC
jgi:hypothetical protein